MIRPSPNSLLLEPLEWDTNFFGFGVARLSAEGKATKEVLSAARLEAASLGFRCIYAELSPASDRSPSWPERIGYQLVDIFVWLRNELDGVRQTEDSPVQIRSGIPADAASLDSLLAVLAPWSRFAMDSCFGENLAFRMYQQWLRRALVSPGQELALVAERKGRPVGFVTCEPTPKPRICLIATTEPRLGIGSALELAAEDWARPLSGELWVKTSLRNLAALRFYERCGFRIEDIRYIYHSWTD